MVHDGGPIIGDTANPSISMQGLAWLYKACMVHAGGPFFRSCSSHKDVRDSTAIRYGLRCWVADADNRGRWG